MILLTLHRLTSFTHSWGRHVNWRCIARDISSGVPLATFHALTPSLGLTYRTTHIYVHLHLLHSLLHMLSPEDHNSDTCRLIFLIRALYTKLNKVLSLTPDRALYRCNDLLHIISRPRHYRSCTVLTIATTHFESVICLALALARLPASTRCRRACHAA